MEGLNSPNHVCKCPKCCNCSHYDYMNEVNELRDYLYSKLEKLGFPSQMNPKKYEYYTALRRMMRLSYNLQESRQKDVVRELVSKGVPKEHIKASIDTIVHAIEINRKFIDR